MSSYLNTLLSRVEDPALRDDLERAVTGKQRKFGLVFEDHEPESVELPGYTVKRGATVRVRAGGRVGGLRDDRLWTVRSVEKRDGQRVAVLIEDRRSGPEPLSIDEPVDNLIVVAKFGTPVYPGLKHLGSVGDATCEKPSQVLIKAENYHALQALTFTHAGAVDCIYIDPPYNLGGDLTYNDHRVSKEDAYRHSKWLSFMERRLTLARDLLKDTGVIIVAIDDTEHARLKLLMDQVFGDANFIANVVWQGGHKNDAKYVSVGHDYMLIYARNEAALRAGGTRWRERKLGIDEALTAAAEIWAETDGEHAQATKRWRAWMKTFKAKGIATDAVTRYTTLDPESGTPIFPGRDLSWPGGGGPRYDVPHPKTGKPVKVPSTGWRFTDPAKLQALIDSGRARFGPDEQSGLQGVSFLTDFETQVAKSVFDVDRRGSAQRLTTLFGERRFSFPKDTNVLARWINLVTSGNPDAVIVDFFAGSGSTGQAVMELNAADGGQRQAILVTNNEVEEKVAKRLAKEGHVPGDATWEEWGIFERVSKPRLATLVSGKREDGSIYSEGMPGERVEFFELTYQDPEKVRLAYAFRAVEPLLWLTAGGVGQFVPASLAKAFTLGGTFAVLHDLNYAAQFTEAVDANERITHAFIVSESQAAYQRIVADVRTDVKTMRLYAAYIRTFQINTAKAAGGQA